MAQCVTSSVLSPVLQSYEGHGLWMLCFSSEYELGQFEKALSEKWKEKFEVAMLQC